MLKHVIYGLVAAISTVSTASTAAEAGPDSLPDRFISAWNAHDLTAFEALYAPDAIWVPVAEERTEGRAAIIAEFAKIHTGNGWAVKTTIAKKDRPKIHLVRPDVAVIFFHMDFLKDGKPIAGLQRAMILVAKRTDRAWQISAGQLTKE